MALSDYLVTLSDEEGGTYKKPYGVKVYEIPHADLDNVRTGFEPQGVSAGGAKTASGSINDKTLTVTAAFFTDTATDAGKAVTVWGVGTRIIDTVTNTTTVEVTVDWAANFSGKSFVMTGNAVWSGDTGPYARRLNRRKLIKVCPGRPTFSRVTAIYEVPETRTLLLEDTTKAHIRVVTGGTPTKRMVEATGSNRIIEGEDPTLGTVLTNKVPVTWKRVAGAPNVQYDRTPHLIVSYASSSLALTTGYGFVGYTNDATMSNLGGALANTMLCIALESERTWDTGSLWFNQMHLLYRAGKWECTSRTYVDVVLEAFGIKHDGNNVVSSGRVERHVITMTATAANNNAGFADVTDLDVTEGEADFSTINTMTEWDA